MSLKNKNENPSALEALGLFHGSRRVGASGYLERETGIEPASFAWKAKALPLSYSRKILLSWCPRGDSNPHAVKRQDLNLVRLPISPRGHCNSSLTAPAFATELVGPDGLEPPTYAV